MGCDIHMFKEKFIGDRWVTADEGWVDEANYEAEGTRKYLPWRNRFTDRNYDLFGLLARGVRREFEFSFEPRGLPLAMSEEVASVAAQDGEDGHNHTYLFLHELRELSAFLKAKTIPVSGMKDSGELDRLETGIACGTPDWDLLYPYCQWGNAPTLRKFNLDVPASFVLGDGIDRIIASFDGIDGDNHRVVFWFDN